MVKQDAHSDLEVDHPSLLIDYYSFSTVEAVKASLHSELGLLGYRPVRRAVLDYLYPATTCSRFSVREGSWLRINNNLTRTSFVSGPLKARRYENLKSGGGEREKEPGGAKNILSCRQDSRSPKG